MVRSIYLTADFVGLGSGGGVVTLNEIEALKSVSDEVVVISRKDILPEKFKQPDSVFLYDYFALNLVKTLAKFDLAHFYSGTFSQTVSYLKSRGTKVSYTVPAHDRHITVEEFQRQGLQYPFPHIEDDNLWYIFSQGYREADLIITPSNVSAKFMQVEGCTNVKVIPHGCYLPETIPPLPEKFTIGYLGVVGIDKGLSYLFAAWSKLNYRDSELLIAGTGTDKLGSFIQRSYNSGKFRLLGWQSNISDFFSQCSVIIQPSVVEAWGIPVGESMSYGRPVIVSDGAGSSDMVSDGIDGFIVPKRSVDIIADKIDYLKNNPHRIIEMSILAREKAKSYSWDKIRDKYVQLWKSI